MQLKNRPIKLLIVFLVLIVLCLSCCRTGDSYAKTSDDTDIAYEPYGLFVNMSISLNGGDGQVWATAKNDFELFSSTVKVIVQLYSSAEYEENYLNMDLVSANSILDLDKGKTVGTYGLTEGKQLYWIGRMRYKVDNKDWVEKIVGPLLYDGNGNFVDIL